MEEIVLDFKKLFATIKNPKNNFLHFRSIGVMIDNFEKKYSETHEISTAIIVLILKRELVETSILYNESTQDNTL